MKRAFAAATSVTLAVLSSLAIARDDKQELTGPEIVAKHLAAVGGKEALARFKSRVALGTVRKENDTAAPFAIMSEAPNRISAIYQFQGYNWQLTYDGSKAFCRPLFSRAAAQIVDRYEEMLASGTMFNGISLYNLVMAGESDGVKFIAKARRKSGANRLMSSK